MWRHKIARNNWRHSPESQPELTEPVKTVLLVDNIDGQCTHNVKISGSQSFTRWLVSPLFRPLFRPCFAPCFASVLLIELFLAAGGGDPKILSCSVPTKRLQCKVPTTMRGMRWGNETGGPVHPLFHPRLAPLSHPMSCPLSYPLCHPLSHCLSHPIFKL